MDALENGPEIAPGVMLPRVGLGVFRAGDPASTRRAVRSALGAGYRHIDTAAIYRNEHDVGAAVREWMEQTGRSRAQVFVTTKLWNEDHGYESTLRAFDASEARLGLGPIDLFLLHWPVPDRRHLEEPALVEVAARFGKTAAQVLLRWSLEQGHVVLPKSSDPGRIAQNASLFDFELDAAALDALGTLSRGLRTAWDPTPVL